MQLMAVRSGIISYLKMENSLTCSTSRKISAMSLIFMHIYIHTQIEIYFLNFSIFYIFDISEFFVHL